MENIEVKRRVEELAKRAQHRRIALPSTKSDRDAKEENMHFEDLKMGIYENLVRSGY